MKLVILEWIILKDEKNDDILGLFQESYNPIGLHVDAGFNLDEIIFKQTLIPLLQKVVLLFLRINFMGTQQILPQMKMNLKLKILNMVKI